MNSRPDWFPERLFPIASHFVAAGVARVHYVDEGGGPGLCVCTAIRRGRSVTGTSSASSAASFAAWPPISPHSDCPRHRAAKTSGRCPTPMF